EGLHTNMPRMRTWFSSYWNRCFCAKQAQRGNYDYLVLVVQEIGGRFKGTGVWKLPTGVIQEGEDIWTGAVREVEEETGYPCFGLLFFFRFKTKFVEVLACRERHQSFFERKSSIFFLCELEASNFEIKKQDSEILDAKVVNSLTYSLVLNFPVDANQPFNQKKEMFRFMGNICLKRSHEKEKYTGFSTVLTKKSAGKESYLYCSTDHANLVNGKCDQASTSFFTTLVHKCFCFT
ncbi:hypothetical protein F2Q68_00003491, partial [Brassica cretica]